jgi:hypothetical protein
MWHFCAHYLAHRLQIEGENVWVRQRPARAAPQTPRDRGWRTRRYLADFAKIVVSFDSQNVSFVSVTQQFNTNISMGRLTLNVLLSFAQSEREVTGEPDIRS